MQKKTWEMAYYQETKRVNRKGLLERAIAADGLTPENELRQKLYNLRYNGSKENQEVDYFIRGLMTLEYMKVSKSIWDHKKKKRRERDSVLKDLQCDLAISCGETGKQIIYSEYCNLIKLYLELCEHDRTYSSLIFGLGKIKRTTFEKKVSDDIYRIAYVVPKVLGIENELCLFSKAASRMLCQQYPEETDSFYKRITESTVVSDW